MRSALMSLFVDDPLFHGLRVADDLRTLTYCGSTLLCVSYIPKIISITLLLDLYYCDSLTFTRSKLFINYCLLSCTSLILW